MDNIREKSMLEKLLAEDKAPWKRWERSVPGNTRLRKIISYHTNGKYIGFL